MNNYTLVSDYCQMYPLYIQVHFPISDMWFFFIEIVFIFIQVLFWYDPHILMRHRNHWFLFWQRKKTLLNYILVYSAHDQWLCLFFCLHYAHKTHCASCCKSHDVLPKSIYCTHMHTAVHMHTRKSHGQHVDRFLMRFLWPSCTPGRWWRHATCLYAHQIQKSLIYKPNA